MFAPLDYKAFILAPNINFEAEKKTKKKKQKKKKKKTDAHTVCKTKKENSSAVFVK